MAVFASGRPSSVPQRHDGLRFGSLKLIARGFDLADPLSFYAMVRPG